MIGSTSMEKPLYRRKGGGLANLASTLPLLQIAAIPQNAAVVGPGSSVRR